MRYGIPTFSLNSYHSIYLYMGCRLLISQTGWWLLTGSQLEQWPITSPVLKVSIFFKDRPSKHLATFYLWIFFCWACCILFSFPNSIPHFIRSYEREVARWHMFGELYSRTKWHCDLYYCTGASDCRDDMYTLAANRLNSDAYEICMSEPNICTSISNCFCYQQKYFSDGLIWLIRNSK